MSSCPHCGVPSRGAERFCGACGKPTSAPGVTTLIAGSDPSCEVVIDHPSVSRRHVSVTLQGANRFLLRDLSSTNGTWIAGTQVTEAEVGADDIVQLGTVRMSARRLVTRLTTPATSGRPLVIGRDPQADISLGLPVVSGRHAEIRAGANGLEIRDLGSTNGTWVDDSPAKEWATVGSNSRLRFGSWRVPSSQIDGWLKRLSAPREKPDEISATVPATGKLRIGRAPDNDVVLRHASVSWHHAIMEVSDSTWILVDLSSSNGTFVGDERVTRRAISPSDTVRIGSVPLVLRPGEVAAQRSYVGQVRLDAIDLVREIEEGPDQGKVILDQVTLTVYPGELVALMGPSGAGKTTLLEVLTGQRRPTRGSVQINGRDLHAHRHLLTDMIGYVPQEDVMHRDLSVFDVLYHSALLRLPGDLPDHQVRQHVDDLITRMGLSHIRDRLVGGEQMRGISGGQRKRVNIAIELITEPPLLFLDEPTSGLDATSTLEVLGMLRDLADHGTTIIMTVHQPRIEAFRLVDMLVLLAKGGKLAYFGSADPGAAKYFAARSPMAKPEGVNPADYVLDVLDPRERAMAREPDWWKSQYRDSAFHREFVAARTTGESGGVTLVAPDKPRRGAAPWGRQLLTLLRRLLVRKSGDTSSMLLQALQPIIVGCLLVAIFSEVDWPPQPTPLPCPPEPYPCPEPVLSPEQQAANQVHAVLFLTAATAFWLGASNVARELVAERPVFLRERLAGLSTTAYVMAHFLAQAGVGALQALVLVGLCWSPILPLESHFFVAYATVFLTVCCGVAVGMAISSAVRTEVTAISSLPLLLLPQLMLAGYLQVYREMSDALQALSHAMPVRWAFEALAEVEYGSGVVLEHNLREAIGFHDAKGTGHVWLAGMMALMLLGTWWRLYALSQPGGKQ